MQHEMRLQNAPFQMIKSGEKTIELRLFDEKRASIRKGDSLVFKNVMTSESIICEVVELHRYASFEELYAHHSKTEIGYREKEEASPQDMLSYYTIEDIQKYGVLGIEIKITS